MNLNAERMARPEGAAEEPTRRYLDRAHLTAYESLAEARRLVWALRPESLERSSLPEALASLVERYSEENGSAASFNITGTPSSLTPEVETTLLRAAQEALSNVRKYARASQIMMTLSYMDDLVTLDVYDDGVGFDPAQVQKRPGDHSKGGFGLRGMRERVEQLGGALLVESEPEEGTTLMVELPTSLGKAANRGNKEALEDTR